MKAKVEIKTSVSIETTVVLTEIEVRALDALVGYGIDSFLANFYKNMGKHYMKPNEEGIRQVFKTVEEKIRPHLARINRIRKELDKITEL